MPPSAICPLVPRYYALGLLLQEPGSRDHRQLLFQLSKKLWTICNNHHRLLYCTPCDIWRFVQKLNGVDLPSARYAKDRSRRVSPPSFLAEGEVGEVFSRSGSCSVSIWEPVEWASYACAPSDRAIKGRNDHSFSAAGSVPSPTPNQLSISGPLAKVSVWCDSKTARTCLAWWNPTTQTMGAKRVTGAIVQHRESTRLPGGRFVATASLEYCSH